MHAHAYSGYAADRTSIGTLNVAGSADRSESLRPSEPPTMVAKVGRLVERAQAGYQRCTDRMMPCGAGNGRALKQRDTCGNQSGLLSYFSNVKCACEGLQPLASH